MQLDARSVVSSRKFDLFKNFLMDFDFDVDILVVGETKLTYGTAGATIYLRVFTTQHVGKRLETN